MSNQNSVFVVVLRIHPLKSDVLQVPANTNLKVGDKFERHPKDNPGDWNVVRVYDPEEGQKLSNLKNLVPDFQALLGF